MRRPRRPPNGCAACGRTDLVPAVDNHGASYMGCPRCRIVIDPARLQAAKDLSTTLARRKWERGHQ